MCFYYPSKVHFVEMPVNFINSLNLHSKFTEFTDQIHRISVTNALPEDVRKAWESLIPLRRGGTPEDVANVALFLASDLSSYVTGQVIHCCGGMNC